MLIDEELLYLEDSEADRVYQELKMKSERRRNMEMRQNRLSRQMSIDEEGERLSQLSGAHSSSSSNRTESNISIDFSFGSKPILSSKNSFAKEPKKDRKKNRDSKKQTN
jgi:hypothetical protein